MAYTPKTWQCDDTITADELNRMEQGIAEASQSGGGTEDFFIVHMTYESEEAEAPTFDKTYTEIKNAYDSGKIVLAYNQSWGIVYYCNGANEYAVNFNGGIVPNGTDNNTLTLTENAFYIRANGQYVDSSHDYTVTTTN